MRKVCHFSSVHRGLDIRIYRKQCVSLARAGFDVHLVIDATAADVAEAAGESVTVHPLGTATGMGRARRMLHQARRCYRIARALDADVYHFHDPELIPYGLLLRRQGRRVIYDLHEDLRADIQSKPWIPAPLRQVTGATARGVEHFAARRLSAVVAATPYIGALFDGSAAQVAVIHNYPMVDELNGTLAAAAASAAGAAGASASAAAAASDAGAAGASASASAAAAAAATAADAVRSAPAITRDSVCYIGAITETRGIRQIIDALDIAPVKLLLAGRFDSEELRAELIQRAGWRHVEEHGFIDRRSIGQIMARSFCGLVTLLPEPNYLNALPIKLFEYMSAGLPVIASNFPLWRGIIDEARCGLCVDPRNPAAIAAAIGHLRSHPDQAAAMGRNGQRAVAEKYRWDREAAKLVALYRSL